MFSDCANIPNEHVRIANKVRTLAVKKIKKKYKLNQVGIHDNLKNCVEMSGASFFYVANYKEKEARSLIVAIVEIYLNEFNENKEIRPFLKNYPFSFENIEIDIYFTNKNNSDVFYPYIGLVSFIDGFIYYKTNNPENKYTYKSVARETFNEALSILKSG